MAERKSRVHTRRTKTVGPSLEETLLRPWYTWSKFPPISVTHPEIAKQWHKQLNGTYSPDEFTFASSAVRVWWKCPGGKDHIWQATVVQRTKSKSHSLGCPFCAGFRPSVTNSLASLYPKVARELHPTKNGKLTADQLVSGTNKRTWWRCAKVSSHVWQATVSDRTRLNSGCPFCCGRRVTKDNSLLSVVPDAKDYWHPTKNGALRPSEVSFGMSEIVWWRCPFAADHIWQAPIQAFASSRRKGASGCPYCAGRRLSLTNLLSVVYPEIASEWHTRKNRKLKPDQITFSSICRVWWQCPADKSHAWEGAPYERTLEGRSCPFCRGFSVNKSNSLATVRPKVVKQWHPTRNGSLTPDMVTEHSSRIVWWRCLQNSRHIFQAKIIWQASIDKARCPKCLPRRTPSEKSLAAKSPDLAKQWHPTLNAPLSAEDILPRSSKKVWWQCPVAEDHFWQQSPNVRAQGVGCPFCARKRKL